ncbi:MAG: helix-turn-helix domain-containing protein [Rhodothermales bacterium]
MTLRELSQLIALGEGQHLEFKQRVPGAERIAKEVTAFANTSGGRLLLGIADDGAIVGVRDATEEEYALGQALIQHCYPPVDFSTERISVTKKRDVIVVSVPASRIKPHFLIGQENGGRTAYVRVEDMSVEASREAIRLMRTRNNHRDVLFEFGEKEQILMRYLDTYGRISVAQFASLANISPRRASHVLVLLTRANVLHLHSDVKEDYFTLAYNLSE